MPPTCYLHGLSAKRKHRNNSLDLMRTGEDPVGNEIVDGYAPTGNSRVEHRLPRVATIAECCRLQLGRDVLPHGVAPCIGGFALLAVQGRQGWPAGSSGRTHGSSYGSRDLPDRLTSSQARTARRGELKASRTWVVRAASPVAVARGRGCAGRRASGRAGDPSGRGTWRRWRRRSPATAAGRLHRRAAGSNRPLATP